MYALILIGSVLLYQLIHLNRPPNQEAKTMLAKKHELTILTWNLDQQKQLDGIGHFINKLEPRPDILAIQEIYNTGLDLLAEKTEFQYLVFGEEFNKIGRGVEGQGTLSRLPFSGSEQANVYFKKQNTLIWRLALRKGGRSFLKTEILLPGGKTLLLYNLHLESKGNDELRRNQLEQAVADSEKYSGDQNTIIAIAGDFNNRQTYSNSKIFERAKKAGFHNYIFETDPETIINKNGNLQIDWILFRGKKVEYATHKIIPTYLSDHNPVVLTVRY